MKTVHILGDPQLRERFRDLPTGYLLDRLADHPDTDEPALRSILEERGLNRQEIDRRVARRTGSRLPHGYTLWRMARTFTLVCTVLVATFNLTTSYQLLHGQQPLRAPLLLGALCCIIFGFLIGFKLNTQLYQGDRHRLFCGFPVAAGYVDLETGHETVRARPALIAGMAVNALVGITLMLFPLLLLVRILGQTGG